MIMDAIIPIVNPCKRVLFACFGLQLPKDCDMKELVPCPNVVPNLISNVNIGTEIPTAIISSTPIKLPTLHQLVHKCIKNCK